MSRLAFKAGFIMGLADRGMTASDFEDGIRKQAIGPLAAVGGVGIPAVLGTTYIGGRALEGVGRIGKTLVLDAPRAAGKMIAGLPEALGIKDPLGRSIKELHGEDLVMAYIEATQRLREHISKIRAEHLKKRKGRTYGHTKPERSTEEAQRLYEQVVAHI